MALEAGFAETDITPAPGAKMAAFPAGRDPLEPRRAESVRDPLRVRVLALRSGDTVLCLVTADLLTWCEPDTDKIRAAAGDVPVVFTASHTHASLENTRLFGGTDDDPPVRRLCEATINAIGAATADLSEAHLAAGTAQAPFNFNRRVIRDGRASMIVRYEAGVTEGPADPTLTLLRFERRAGPTLLWTHWAAHPLTLGPGNRRFSADFPGELRAAVEAERPEARLLFTNGAAGDLHPRDCMRDGDGPLVALGQRLVPPLVAAGKTAVPLPGARLRLVTRDVRFPHRGEADLSVERRLHCLHITSAGEPRPRLAVGFMPGEPFSDLQRRYRQALPGVGAPLVGYADAWAGYVPTRGAYGHGGYGVDYAPDDPPRYCRTMLPPGAGESMIETLIEMARGAG